MTVAPRALARIEHSEALLTALRHRLVELNLTHEVVDHCAGFQNGYCSKLLSSPPQKRLGHFSLFVLLQVLGLDIVLVENPERLESLKNPMHLRRRPFVLRAPSIVCLSPDFMRANGVKGARARNAKLSEHRRSAIARRAAKARWARARATSQPTPVP